jgi:hypothetical protein
MESFENDILNITDEEIKNILDPLNTMKEIKKSDLVISNDGDYYKAGGITIDQYNQRREIFLKVLADFGDDPYFKNIFGAYDYSNSIQFLKMSDVIYIINQTSLKEIKDINLRNPNIGKIYKKLKQRIKDLKKLEEKNISFTIIDNGITETTATDESLGDGDRKIYELTTSAKDD